MKHVILTMIFAALFTQITYGAERYDDKSFRVINNLCGMCHGTPFYFAKQKDEESWTEYFEGNKALVAVHQKDPKALKHIQSKRFKHYKKRILKFFIANSKYSGAVHGCDANFCGAHH